MPVSVRDAGLLHTTFSFSVMACAVLLEVLLSFDLFRGAYITYLSYWFPFKSPVLTLFLYLFSSYVSGHCRSLCY